MTPQTKRRAWLLSLLTAALSALCAPLLGAAWNSKVSTSTFESAMQKNAAEIKELRGITKDILCAQQPSHWRCHS